MASPLTIKITTSGEIKLRGAAKAEEAKAIAAVVAAVYQIGFFLDRKAIRLVPVQTGRLKSSHYVSPPKGRNNTVEVGFGTDYAIVEHEKHRTKSQYLRIPFDKLAGTFDRKVGTLARRNFKAGIGVKSLAAEAPERPKT